MQTAGDIPFNERQFFRVLPLLVSYIKTDKKLSDEETLKLMRMFPERRGRDEGSHHDRLMRMAIKYKDDRIFGKAVGIVLSEEGRRWMAGFYEHAGRIAPESIKHFK